MTSTTLPRSKLSEHLYGWQGGDGPSLMLIHGVGLNADSWGPMLPYLEKYFSITAIDLPGHGKSPSITANSLSDYAQKIADILPNNCFIVGHSLGALLTLELALTAPDKIAAIAPLNAVYRRTEDAQRAVQKRAKALNHMKNSDPSQTLERWFGAKPEDTNKEMSKRCERWLNQVDPMAYKQAYTIFAHANSPSENALARIACPALFITGEDEPNSTPAMSQNLAKHVAHGQALIVPDAKHMMPMTHAGIVANALIKFHHTEVLSHV